MSFSAHRQPKPRIAQAFTKGDIVEVYNTGGVGLRVRDNPCGNKIRNKPDGSVGIILEGPSFCVLEGTGYNWWRVRWSDGLEGWSAENWLRRASLPSITSASPSPSTVSPGRAVTFTYNVTNSGREIGGAIAPLLGASIQLSGGGPYLSAPPNDRKATIPYGSGSVSRPFVVPSTATPGTYDLLVSLVADVNNNGIIDSGDRTWDLKRFSGVLQVQVICTYSIFPTSQSFGSAGGSGQVNVTAPSGCSWAATSSASWITITSGSSGNGNGTVNYSIAAESDEGNNTRSGI
ncbi:MAG: BACON domain-containing protein [Candidatus Bipolaricaulia bacterium]